MALIKADHLLENIECVFDKDGNVSDMRIQVNLVIKDDVTGVEETRVRRSLSVWDSLTDTEKREANSMGRRLNALAASV